MMLWPLSIATLRTWGQIFAMGSCCFSVWIIFAHLGVSRLRIPSLADTVVVFIIPLAILLRKTIEFSGGTSNPNRLSP